MSITLFLLLGLFKVLPYYAVEVVVVVKIIIIILIAELVQSTWVEATDLTLTPPVGLLDVRDHALLSAIICVRIDHCINGLEVVCLGRWQWRGLCGPRVGQLLLKTGRFISTWVRE